MRRYENCQQLTETGKVRISSGLLGVSALSWAEKSFLEVSPTAHFMGLGRSRSAGCRDLAPSNVDKLLCYAPERSQQLVWSASLKHLRYLSRSSESIQLNVADRWSVRGRVLRWSLIGFANAR
jgi:hypothetical protein